MQLLEFVPIVVGITVLVVLRIWGLPALFAKVVKSTGAHTPRWTWPLLGAAIVPFAQWIKYLIWAQYSDPKVWVYAIGCATGFALGCVIALAKKP